MNNKTMTLGEFRKWTENLSNDVKLNLEYGGGIFPIKAMDCLDENNIKFGGDIYDEQNIMGSIRVATFCKRKEHNFKIGDIVYWNDPCINDYPEDERDFILNQKFIIIKINGEYEDSIITITNLYTDVEVYPNELVKER